MDFLKSALDTYQNQSHSHDNDHEDKAVMHNSLKDVHETGVAPPEESDLHEAKAAHEKVYAERAGSEASDDELGKAAGVEAFHAYERAESSGETSGGGKGQLIQMAMAEATKMFSGNDGADKSAVIKSAIAMATKLYMGKSGEGGSGVNQLMAMFSGGGKDGESGSGKMNDVMGMLGQASQNPQVASMLKKFM
ncbi:hypothetical protein BGZ46_000271 [Entomortierella lignicola]|nr:hypothetical protein BGZ46_000271 [Entomortierella lignicola]